MLICPAAHPRGGVIHIRETAPGQPTGCQRAQLSGLGELAVHRLHPLTDYARHLQNITNSQVFSKKSCACAAGDDL